MLKTTCMDMKELREKARLSAEEAAFKLQVSHSTIRNWESGRTEPSLGVTKLSQLLKLYNCSFEELEQAVIESKTKAQEN